MSTRASPGQAPPPEMIVDPIESAKAARLRYVSDSGPGIRRAPRRSPGSGRSGNEFRYLDPQGRTIHDPDELQRIKALGIPPAWTDVWICPQPNGHIQATGRDARGASSTATTNAGARCATRASTAA